MHEANNGSIFFHNIAMYSGKTIQFHSSDSARPTFSSSSDSSFGCAKVRRILNLTFISSSLASDMDRFSKIDASLLEMHKETPISSGRDATWKVLPFCLLIKVFNGSFDYLFHDFQVVLGISIGLFSQCDSLSVDTFPCGSGSGKEFLSQLIKLGKPTSLRIQQSGKSKEHGVTCVTKPYHSILRQQRAGCHTSH